LVISVTAGIMTVACEQHHDPHFFRDTDILKYRNDEKWLMGKELLLKNGKSLDKRSWVRPWTTISVTFKMYWILVGIYTVTRLPWYDGNDHLHWNKRVWNLYIFLNIFFGLSLLFFVISSFGCLATVHRYSKDVVRCRRCIACWCCCSWRRTQLLPRIIVLWIVDTVFVHHQRTLNAYFPLKGR
jgi:hypothetical protein